VRERRQCAVHLWNHAMVVYEPQHSFPIQRTRENVSDAPAGFVAAWIGTARE